MIYFKIITRKSPKDGSKKYYAQVYGRKVISQRALMEDVEKQTSLTSGDVKNAIETLVYVIKKNLSEGRSVKLDGLGTFSVNLKSRGAATEKEFKATTDIISKSINFRPSTDVREYVRMAGVANWDSEFGEKETKTTGGGSSEVKPNA